MGNWVFMIFFLFFTFSALSSSESIHENKIPSAVVVGTVYCDTCFQDDFSKESHFISGASVAVECEDGNSKKPSFHREVETDEHGEFKVKLPLSVSKHVRKIKRCSVKLLRSSEPNCAVASTATSSSLRLKARKEGTHIFSAGFFTFKPEKQPYLCNQKPENPDRLGSKKYYIPRIPKFDPTFPPPLSDPATPFLPPRILPPLPLLPKLPPLPQLPPLPLLPPLPGKARAETEQKVENSNQFGFPTPIPFPTNPRNSPLIPNPLQPPSFLPSNRLLPSPGSLIPLPPIPGLPPPSIPGLPTPTIPGLPTPSIPGFTPPSIPGLPTPPIPGLPIPPIPGLPIPPIPGLPTIPGHPTPSIPGLPTPSIPGLSPPGLPPPSIPGLPTIPGLPPIPGLPSPPPFKTSLSQKKSP